MLNFDLFLSNILNDLRVELADEFDRNFERKAFFTEAWPHVRREPGRGSLMLRTGALRQSIHAEVAGTQIRFSSSLPYASLHNAGGELTVTPKMKKFFWAMHIKAKGGIATTSRGAPRATRANIAISQEAEMWKRMALMKVGAKIKIPRRQFLGHHGEVDRMVREVVDANVQELADGITAELRRQGGH